MIRELFNAWIESRRARWAIGILRLEADKLRAFGDRSTRDLAKYLEDLAKYIEDK